MAKMLDGVLQQAKEPTPEVPLSQQLKSDQYSPATNCAWKAHYSVVDVIAPPQNLIPAVEPVAT